MFARVLEKAKIANPLAVRDRRPRRRVRDRRPPAAGTKLMLRTDLEPDVAKAELDQLKKSLADDPDLLFERITNFGGTVAGETRNAGPDRHVRELGHHHRLPLVAVPLVHLRPGGRARRRARRLDHPGRDRRQLLAGQGPRASTLLLQIDQFKIDLPIVAAFLTLIGFSVNDTIVIFDRIREIKGKTPHLTNKMVNDALNQTLSRTILTSFTAWLVVVILYLFGGEGLARLRLRAGRRLPERHLQHDLHRHADPDRLGRDQARGRQGRQAAGDGQVTRRRRSRAQATERPSSLLYLFLKTIHVFALGGAAGRSSLLGLFRGIEHQVFLIEYRHVVAARQPVARCHRANAAHTRQTVRGGTTDDQFVGLRGFNREAESSVTVCDVASYSALRL